MDLEVARAFGSQADRLAADKLIALGLVFGEANGDSANASLYCRNEPLGFNGLPYTVEIIEYGAIVQARVIALSGAPVDFGARSPVRRQHKTAADVTHNTVHRRRVQKGTGAERIDCLSVRTVCCRTQSNVQ